MTVRTGILFFSIILCFLSCKPGAVSMRNPSGSKLPYMGVIGIVNSGIFYNSFTSVGVPLLEVPIKLSVQKKIMTKKEKGRLKSLSLRGEDNLHRNDGSNTFYYSFQIHDQFSFIGEINSSYNEETKKYLLATQNSVLITSVEIHFPSGKDTLIDQALDIYLVSTNPGAFALELWKKDGEKDMVNFSDGEILNYDYSFFCWSQDVRRKPLISALIGSDRACPGRTVKNPSELEKEDPFKRLR